MHLFLFLPTSAKIACRSWRTITVGTADGHRRNQYCTTDGSPADRSLAHVATYHTFRSVFAKTTA